MALKHIGADLKALLNDDQIKQLEALLKDQDFIIETTKNFRPLDRVKEIETARDEFKTKYEAVNGELEKLKPLAAGNEALSKQITDLQAAHAKEKADYETRISEQQFGYALANSMRGFKPKNEKAARALLDMEAVKKLPVKDDRLDGFDAIMTPIVKENPYLFEQETKPQLRFGLPIDKSIGGDQSLDEKAAAIAKEHGVQLPVQK